MSTVSPFRWLKRVLIVSLCLNLLLVGAATAIAVRWQLHPDAQIYRVALRQLTRQLDHADAGIVRRTFFERREQARSANADYRRALRELLAALQESPRDDARLQAAIRDARAKRAAQSDVTFDSLLGSLQEISPAGRDALLKARP